MSNQQQPVLIEFFDDEIEPPSFPFLNETSSPTPEDGVAAATAELFSSLETAMAVDDKDDEDDEEDAAQGDAGWEMPSDGSAPGGQNNSAVASDSVGKGRGQSWQRSGSRNSWSGAGARAPAASLKPAVPSAKPTGKPPTSKKTPKGIVDHTYRDFSGIPRDPKDKPIDDLELSELSFSQKLHMILSTKEHANCISWMPHGRAFRILIPKVFETKVAPIFFDHSRYSTFLRQLNNHGFKHITRGTDRNCYYHEAFLRGLPHLCKFMPRPKNARRLAPDSENEPNFYWISEAFPLPDASTESFVRAGKGNIGHGEDPDSKPAPKPPSEGIDNIPNNTISREEAVSHAASLQHALNLQQQVQDALDRENSIKILLGHMTAGSLPFPGLNYRQVKPNAQNFGQPPAVAFPLRAGIDNQVSSHDISASVALIASLFEPDANGLLPKANLQSSLQMNPFGTVAMGQQSSAPTGQHMNMNLAPHLVGSPMMSLGL